MNQIELRQTNFDVAPLRNVVGVGNNTAYQICVTRGKVLATLGTLEEFAAHSPINDTRYDDNKPGPASGSQPRSWFRRVINA